jgi:LacI family transcriptional regulator
LARALVSGYSRTIALVVSDISNPFYPQLAKSVEREARLQGFAMVICNTEDEPDETVRYVRELIDHGVAGIVHGSVGLDEQRVLDVLGDARRIVFTNRRPVSGAVSYAVSDNRLGARLLGEHLTDLGHRRIGFIAGPVWAANSRERLVGLAEAAAAAGAELLSLHGDFTPDSVAGMLDTWLADGPYPTAVVGVSDHVALAALAGLNERGFRIPNDVAVAGFDDINLVVSRLLGLTTVAQRIDELGRRAVQILLRQLRSKTFRVQRVELAPDLVIRQTTRREVQPAAPRSVSVDHLSERALRTIAD